MKLIVFLLIVIVGGGLLLMLDTPPPPDEALAARDQAPARPYQKMKHYEFITASTAETTYAIPTCFGTAFRPKRGLIKARHDNSGTGHVKITVYYPFNKGPGSATDSLEFKWQFLAQGTMLNFQDVPLYGPFSDTLRLEINANIHDAAFFFWGD